MQNVDLFFLLLGAVLVLAMHAGFAFLELGTVRHKNQVNALSKILTDFALSAIAYFFVGYYISYGQHFFHDGTVLSVIMAITLCVASLLTFAAAIPAIISGGIAERAKCVHKRLPHSHWLHWFIRSSREWSGMATTVCKSG